MDLWYIFRGLDLKLVAVMLTIAVDIFGYYGLRAAVVIFWYALRRIPIAAVLWSSCSNAQMSNSYSACRSLPVRRPPAFTCALPTHPLRNIVVTSLARRYDQMHTYPSCRGCYRRSTKLLIKLYNLLSFSIMRGNTPNAKAGVSNPYYFRIDFTSLIISKIILF